MWHPHSGRIRRRSMPTSSCPMRWRCCTGPPAHTAGRQSRTPDHPSINITIRSCTTCARGFALARLWAIFARHNFKISMSRYNLHLKHHDLPYRPCVGVMLLNRDGHVFVGKRIDQTVEGWQMPQGGIDAGETPEEAARRELEEEIGTGNARLLREYPEWLCYDLPSHLLGVALRGRFRGQ